MAKKPQKTGPRKVPERDDFYLGLAYWLAAKSKDPNTQCGAIIIAANNAPIGFGYNGPPASYDDKELDWSRPGKNDHIIHSEQNAIKWCAAKWLLPGSTLYVTSRPCKVCMSAIANEGIKRVVFFPTCHDPDSMVVRDKDVIEDIARRGKVELVEFKGNLNWMRDRMLFMEQVLGIF